MKKEKELLEAVRLSAEKYGKAAGAATLNPGSQLYKEASLLARGVTENAVFELARFYREKYLDSHNAAQVTPERCAGCKVPLGRRDCGLCAELSDIPPGTDAGGEA